MTIVEGFKKYSELMIELEYSVLKYIEHIKELENQTFKEQVLKETINLEDKRFVHMLGPQKVALLSIRKCDQMAEYLGNTVSRKYQKFDKFKN